MLKSMLGLMLPNPHAGGPHPRNEADFPKKKERDAWIIIYASTAGRKAMSLKTAEQHPNDKPETLYARWIQSPKKTKAKTTTWSLMIRLLAKLTMLLKLNSRSTWAPNTKNTLCSRIFNSLSCSIVSESCLNTPLYY